MSTDEHPKLRVGGRTISLVPQSHVEHWTYERAVFQLAAFADHWVGREALLRLSDSLFGPDDDIERAIAYLAMELERGRLVAVRLPDPHRGMSPLPRETLDWDDVPMLSDLLPRGCGERPRSIDEPEPRPLPTELPAVVPSAVEPDADNEGEVEHFVGFIVVDPDGANIAGSYRITIGAEVHTGELGGAEIRVSTLLAEHGAVLEVWPSGYVRRSRAVDELATRAGDFEVDVTDQLGPLTLACDRVTRIVVRVPKATVFTLPAYALDLEVFRPGWLWFDSTAGEGTSGLGCLAQILAYAHANPERYVLAVGHTDTSGTKSHNRGVAERRAAHLSALLRADVEGWIASCEADGVLADVAAHMQWAARRFGWACDAGIVEHRSDAFDAALGVWRERAAELTGIAIDPDAPRGADDWRVAYALLDLALAEELGVDLPTLAAIRTQLQWCSPAIIGAGELWPREMVGKDGVTSSVNRRTEIMFANVAEIPGGVGDPAGASLFGEVARLWLDYIDPERRAALPLGLVSTDGIAVPGAAFKIVSAQGRVRYGALGPAGETIVADVAAGDFAVHWIDPDRIAGAIWIERCSRALAARDFAVMGQFLALGPALVQLVVQRWADERGGGDLASLPDAIRAAAGGDASALSIELMLDRQGFAGRTRFELLPAHEIEGAS